MGKEPEVIEKDIEGTRKDLSRDFDALADKVSPGRVVGRQVDSVKGKFAGARDKVMGTAHSTGGSVASAPGNAATSVSHAAQGNPLAAGVIAFGLGWLVSSLAPATQKEAELASHTVDVAKEHAQPLVDHVKATAQESGDQLMDKATDAATELKDSAMESVEHVKSDGQSAAKSVKDDVQA